MFAFLKSLFGNRGSTWEPRRSGLRFRQVVVYTREGCHLCDEAVAVLKKFCDWLPEPREVDIDTDPELQERFGLTIPVVEFDGKIRFKGRVQKQLLRRLIEGTLPVDRGL